MKLGGLTIRYVVRILASDMKIISYSDLHLEFPHKWNLPPDIDGDILVLAGDIITFKDFAPLAALLQGWEKPALFVAGNHEYYTRSPMQDDEKWFKSWLSKEFPNVYFLCNEGVVIYGVNFFGGTMWTNFKFSNKASMRYAAKGLNDFRYIWNEGIFTPEDSVKLHQQFVSALELWFEQKQPGPHIVHTPCAGHKSQIPVFDEPAGTGICLI